MQGRASKYSKESEKQLGRAQNRPIWASQFLYLDSGAGHDNVRRAKTQFSLVIVSATFGLGNQQKPYDFKAFSMISGDLSWPSGLAAGRLAVRLEASASRSVSLFRLLRQFFYLTPCCTANDVKYAKQVGCAW